MKKKKKTAVLAGIAAAALLAGCSANDEAAPTATVTSEVTVTATAFAAAATETVTVTATPAAPETSAAPAAPEGGLALGDTLTLDLATVTVFEASQGTDALDDAYFGYRVEVCNTGTQEIAVSMEPWVGVDSEGGRYTPMPMISGSLSPEMPGYSTMNEAITPPGDCLMGWVPFDAEMAELRYRNSFGDTGTWSVSN